MRGPDRCVRPHSPAVLDDEHPFGLRPLRWYGSRLRAGSIRHDGDSDKLDAPDR